MQNILNIIDKASKGDKAAFSQLVSHHQQYAFNLAFRIVCNEDDAMDIVQDSFIKIWKNMEQYNPSIKFTTWMFKIVSNTAIDFLRAIKKRNTINIDNLFNLPELFNPEHADTILSNQETGQLINRITSTLSEKQKLVFTLRDLQGLTTAEVGEVLGLSATSIKSNLYYARKTIREKMQEFINYERSVK
jgi:RNA polymerase sigma-70 factor (ECF subfamily)